MRRLALFLAAILSLTGNANAERDGMKENPFGVLEFLPWNHEWNNYHYSSDERLAKACVLMKKAGVGMVRMDFLWQDIEPQKGCFDFARYDHIVEMLERHGIDILGVLQYSADWSSPTGVWNDPADDHSAFLNYARITAERYKGRVRHWELWNEPDSPVYWKRQDGLKSYCGLLREVYGELKRIDPECVVLNGGLTYNLSSVNRLYDNGGGGCFDALNIHAFENPASDHDVTKPLKAYIRACARVMERNGDGDKKIWVTETGCPGMRPGITRKNWWLGKNPDERTQAAWVRAMFDTLLAEPKVGRVFWAFFRDTDRHWKDGTDYFGLVRNDFSVKRSYKAYADAYRAWEKGKNKGSR